MRFQVIEQRLFHLVAPLLAHRNARAGLHQDVVFADLDNVGKVHHEALMAPHEPRPLRF